MRTISVTALILMLSVSARAQATTGYEQSASVVDSSGNLLVFDSGITVTTVSNTASTSNLVNLLNITLQPIIASRVPTTRITVVPHGAASAETPVVYSDSSFQIIGVGKDAVYALVTVYPSGSTKSATQEIVAINANFALPGALTGFPELSISPGEAIELGPPVGTSDFLALTMPATRAMGSTTATPRTVKVYSFDTSFHLLSQATLP